MSSKVKPLPACLLMGAFLIPSFYACGLAGHLTFEGLLPVDGKTDFDPVAQAAVRSFPPLISPILPPPNG
jgi:hypothetical protein